MNIKTIELNNGEFAGMGVLEVTKIPAQEILKTSYPEGTDIEKEYQRGFGNLLAELYQRYKLLSTAEMDFELSIELLWITEPAFNQPFKASISMFMILRSIALEEEKAVSTVENMISSCDSMLRMYQYGSKAVDASVICNRIQNIEIESIELIVKDERIETLQNQILPLCYSFDRLNSTARDLGAIVNNLIIHPHTVFSVQLIPTELSSEEISAITQLTPMLDTLSRGVMAQGIGSVSFSNAENLSETYKYYQNNRRNELFAYNFSVFGKEASVDDISSKVHSTLSYETSNSIALKHIHFSNDEIQICKNIVQLPWVINELAVQAERNADIWSQELDFHDYYRFPYIITAEEASGLFRLPIGTQRISAGLPINETENPSKTYAGNLINAGDIDIGLMKSSDNKNFIGISLEDMAKHMLVVGTPGSGKTTFSVGLLDRIWREHRIPFLVIEPAKNEYRSLIQNIPELQIFTPGKNHISPFVFNPFTPPKNVRLETYKSTLKTAFEAAVSMTTPLDKIFEEAINNCYSDFRWLDTYTVDDKGQIFNISDFIKCFQKTFDEIGYTGDAKNIGRAGVVRLNSLINLFDNYYSIPIQDILKKPTVIELAAIENNEQRALLISLLLLSILAYVNSNYIGEGGLKNVILLEEAHVLLDSESNINVGDANPSAIAQGLLKRMLAEIRSYGVGIIVADQSPRKVSSDVIALTDIKLVFRIVEATDKQIIADSMNMSDAQVQRLSRLKPGEAFVFFNRLDDPEEVSTPDYRRQNRIRITLSDDEIRKLPSYWDSRQLCLRPYPECQITNYCNKSCDYSKRVLSREIARRIFVKYFKKDMDDFEQLKKVFGQITYLVKKELDDEVFSNELLSCVKVHLWRKIRYNTMIPISDIQIMNSLKKS